MSASPPPAGPSSLRVERREEGIAVVWFDRPKSSANILDTGTLEELDRVVAALNGDAAVRGVVFASAKPSVFIAGADVRELAAAPNRPALIERGQQLFCRIADLRSVTVAAIHGACAGGGLELALACDYRLASPDRATRIGLPEVMLGILPAWGGSTRLPRLIGLRGALDTILRGELMPAAKAKKKGIVDALAPRERLVELATRFVDKGKRRARAHFPWIAVAPAVAAFARRSVLRKTRGHYPAPLAAINVVTNSVGRSIKASLAAEKETVLQLAETTACHNLLRVFLSQDRAKHRAAAGARPIHTAAVIGAGVMGSGIAQWLAARGLTVFLRDEAAEPLARGLQRAGKLFAAARKRGLMSGSEAQAGMDRIVPIEAAAGLHPAQLVIEAVVEHMDVKKKLFARLETETDAGTLLATNTSALSVTEIAAGLMRPERVVGLHFFNPVHRMKLVEVVRTDRASEEFVNTAAAFVVKIGKLPLVVRDRPGFLVNRILLPYLLEAAHLFAGGADVAALDECMLDFGMPMGPMRLLDEVGLDVAADVAETLCAAFPDRMTMPESLDSLIKAGFKGRKSGAGFYLYRRGEEGPVNPAVRALHASHQHHELSQTELRLRMGLLMINEAARCLEEQVVDSPEDVDFGMIQGTGFAPFRGGPLRMADAFGIARITRELDRLAATEGRFQPAASLVEMTRHQQTFYAS